MLRAISLGVCCWFALLADSPRAAERAAWTTSRVKGSPEPPKPFAVQRVYPKLGFDQPVELMPLPGTNKMLLLEVTGKVYLFDDRQDVERAELVFDVSQRIDDFRRAFTISPHPKFAENGFVFICYCGNPVARPDGTRLSRFKLTLGKEPTIDPASEVILLTWASGGHNGCSIEFDNQGLLYFSAGDGARPFPPDEYDVSQDLSDLRATICRIDADHPDGDRPYSIPEDNPFVDLPGARPEIWAYGFRNPWRFSIDPRTQQVLCGDVGWELWELVFHVERGGNYGWSLFEGPQPIRSDITPGPTPIRKPLVAYPHTVGLSVTGGHTYYGQELPSLSGTFLYGDYVTGLLWGLRFEGEEVTFNEVLAETGLPIITFAQTREGEPLVVSFTGEIYQLVPNPSAGQPSEFPQTLSETGLFADTATLEPARGVYPYSVVATSFQNEVSHEFVVGIPGMGTVQTNRMKRNWKFPVDTVFANTISRDVVHEGQVKHRRLETQILHFNGLSWQPYCYVWNSEQTDATLLDSEGATIDLKVLDSKTSKPQTLPWRHHGRSECRACHTNQTGGAIAFSYENLIGNASFAPGEDLLSAFVDIGILDKHAPKSWNVKAMVDPSDKQQSLEARARSYLAANCAHCHCRGGGGTVALDVSYSNDTEAINAVDYPTTQGEFGIEGARVITPGNPYTSILFYRMATSGNGHMPKLWTRDNDPEGLRLVHDWIASLDPDHFRESHSAQAAPTSAALNSFHTILVQETDQAERARAALERADALTVGLFERFLPPTERVKRLGNEIDPAAILALEGDATAGRERFLSSQVQQCRNCHRVAGHGQMVGPDLDGIAKKRSRAEILHSILSPSEKIEPEFATHSVVTIDGQVISGLRLEPGAEELVIRSTDGKTHRLMRDDIEHETRQLKSLMPDGLAAQMTAEELADLLAFLDSLK